MLLTEQLYNTKRMYFHSSPRRDADIAYRIHHPKDWDGYFPCIYLTTDILYSIREYCRYPSSNEYGTVFICRLKPNLNICNANASSDKLRLQRILLDLNYDKKDVINIVKELQNSDWFKVLEDRESVIKEIAKTYDGFFNFELNKRKNPSIGIFREDAVIFKSYFYEDFLELNISQADILREKIESEIELLKKSYKEFTALKSSKVLEDKLKFEEYLLGLDLDYTPYFIIDHIVDECKKEVFDLKENTKRIRYYLRDRPPLAFIKRLDRNKYENFLRGTDNDI